MSAARSRTGWPFQATSPESSGSSPRRALRRVVFPEPIRPVTTVSLPRRRYRLTRSMPRPEPGTGSSGLLASSRSSVCQVGSRSPRRRRRDVVREDRTRADERLAPPSGSSPSSRSKDTSVCRCLPRNSPKAPVTRARMPR